MDALLKMIKNIENLSVGRVFFLVFSETINQKLIIQLNQENQLQFGILADEKELPFYSKTSVDVYGKPSGKRWTLKDTGDFYDSFDIVQVTEKDLTINADSVKEDVDLSEYGKILGLTEESRLILKDKIIGQVQEIILNEILAIN